MKDFWSFDRKSLEKEISTVNGILKEQANLLTNKTGGILIGRVSNRKLERKDGFYDIETLFEIKVPNLANYVCRLFYVYSNARKNFPVLINYERLEDRNLRKLEAFGQENEAKNESEFEKLLKNILQSPEVNETVKVLYAKASQN